MKAGVPIQLTLYPLFTLALPETTCSLGLEVGHVRGAHRKTPVGPSLVKWGHDALIKIIAVMLCVEENIPQPG